MKRLLVIPAVAVLLMATVCSCGARPLPTASTDIVPREDWSYDAMTHLAGHGLVPGETANRFSGQWLFSREEMAGFVAKAIEQAADATPDADKALLGKLAMEYRAELIGQRQQAALAKTEPWLAIKTVLPTGFLDARIVSKHGDTQPEGIYHITGLASINKNVMAGATLDNERWLFDGHEFSRLEKYFVRGRTPSVEWELGKDFMSWGPEYSGPFALSDNSPGFLMGKLGKDFYLGRRIGYVKVTEFVSTFHDNLPGAPMRYWFYGRRWEKRFSRNFHFAMNEMAKTTNIHPDPLVLVTPFYLYQHIAGVNTDTEMNNMLSMDGTYQLSRRFQMYADWFVDDMQAPRFLHHGPSWNHPRKTAWMVGGYCPDVLSDGTTGLRAEYLLVDKETYTASRTMYPGLAYTHDGDVIGSPLGPNSKAFFLRADRKLADYWNLSAEYLNRTPKALDGPNPFDTSRLSLYVSRSVTPRSTLWLRYDRLKLPAKENQLQIAGSWAF